MKRVGDGVYRCVDRSEIRIKPLDAPDLPLANEPGSTLREIIWGVDTNRALDAIRKELARDRDVRSERNGTFHTVDDAGNAIAFRLTKRIKLKIKPLGFNAPGAPGRIDKPTTYYARAKPQEVSHVVIGVPDMKAVEDFYVKRSASASPTAMPVARCSCAAAPSGNHHHLFLLNATDGQRHFNHIAFKVRNVHEVIGGGQFISRARLGDPGRARPALCLVRLFLVLQEPARRRRGIRGRRRCRDAEMESAHASNYARDILRMDLQRAGRQEARRRADLCEPRRL